MRRFFSNADFYRRSLIFHHRNLAAPISVSLLLSSCIQNRFKSRTADLDHRTLRSLEKEKKDFDDALAEENIPPPPDAIIIDDRVKNLIEVQFCRSQGAGGQNVNKVNTKAEIRYLLFSQRYLDALEQFHVHNATWMSHEVKAAFAKLNATRINNVGEFILNASETRSAHKNLEIAYDKLYVFVREAQLASIPVVRKDISSGFEEKGSVAVGRMTSKKEHSKKKADRRNFDV